MKKYEAPRAVRLSDANTASMECYNGPTGTRNICQSGITPDDRFICRDGSSVQGSF
jgi:hypothetical protein